MNLKLLNLLFFLIILTASSCLAPKKGNKNYSEDYFPGLELISINQNFSKSIEEQAVQFHYFTAGNGVHLLSLTNLTTDVHMDLYEYVPNSSLADQVFLSSSQKIGTIDESIYYNLTSGNEYLIVVTECNGSNGNYSLRITNPATPPQIESLNVNQAYTKQINGNAMYTFTAGSPANHSISLTNLTVKANLELYEYDSSNLLQDQIFLKKSNNSGLLNEKIYADLIPGKKYLINIVHSDVTAGSGVVMITTPDAPPAIAGININQIYNNQINGNSDVMFTFTAGGTQNHSMSLTNLTADLNLELYKYVSTNILEDQIFLVGSAKSGTDDEKIYKVLTAGTTYLVRIINYSSSSANYSLKITYPDNPPAESIVTLNVNQDYLKPIAADGAGSVNLNNAYFFIAGSGSHTISITNNTSDLELELYEYDGTEPVLDILNAGYWLEISNNEGTVPEGITTSSLTSGAKYLIHVSEWDGVDGTFTIRISNP